MSGFKYKQKFNPLTGQFDLVWSGKTVSANGTVWTWTTNNSGAWVSTQPTAGGTFDFIDGTEFQFIDGTYFDFIT